MANRSTSSDYAKIQAWVYKPLVRAFRAHCAMEGLEYSPFLERAMYEYMKTLGVEVELPKDE